jgi:hypothetical protein
MSLELVLFSTDHCTLCDEALDMLLSMPELAGRSVRVIDVAEDAELLDSLGERIPILEVRGRGTVANCVRLEWPFDSEDVVGSIRQIE